MAAHAYPHATAAGKLAHGVLLLQVFENILLILVPVGVAAVAMPYEIGLLRLSHIPASHAPCFTLLLRGGCYTASVKNKNRRRRQSSNHERMGIMTDNEQLNQGAQLNDAELEQVDGGRG